MTEATRGTLSIPEGAHSIPPTLEAQIDASIADLQAKADDWVSLDVASRIQLLEELAASTLAVGEPWVEAARQAKAIPADSPALSEEWMGGPWTTLRNIRLLRQSLEGIRDHGRPQLPAAPTQRADGTTVVPVFPTDKFDKVLFSGFTAEVWMQDGVTPADVLARQASAYTGGEKRPGTVGLVLGAGNVASIGPMDALYKLFVDDEVVLLKMNPVNEYVGPFIEQAFAPLIDRGYLRIVYGGATEGAYLTSHDGIGSIHITGSDKTHDAIVFGGGAAGAKRKAANDPLLDKPISSELGNVTPVIVVPGPWSDKEIAYQARNIATMLVNNGGFNCIAARMLVTHGAWSKRKQLLDAIRTEFARIPNRDPYYPGAEDRQQAFLEEHPDGERYGREGEGRVPWTLFTDLDAGKADDICFTTEAFCGAMGEVPLPSPRDVSQYVRDAVRFANEQLWGTLAATIIVHPASLRDPEVAAAVEEAIADLEYGTIVVNHWAGLGYGLVSTPWGAYPGHTMDDIQSGRGVVHNSYLLEGTQKAVVRGPFKSVPVPPWFAGHKGGTEVNRRLSAFEANPSAKHLPGVFKAALRG